MPTAFHLGWIALLVVLGAAALFGERAGALVGRRRVASALVQGLLALGVIGWAAASLSEIAADHDPALEVLGYVLEPPAEGPPVTTLGNGPEADVLLGDPHAAAVHAVLRWEDGGAGDPIPTLWNASAQHRIEVDGLPLHDVVLRGGTRLRGGADPGWEVATAGAWPGVTLVGAGGEVTRLRAPLGRGLVSMLPGIGPRLRTSLGWILAADGGLELVRGTRPLPGDGPVAELYLRGGEVRLGFAGPEDRAEHPLLVEADGAVFRPADRARRLADGDLLTLGYSRWAARVQRGGGVVLSAASSPTTLPWPAEEAALVGPGDGVLLYGDADGRALSVAVPRSSEGLRKTAGRWRLASGGAPRATLAPGDELSIPWAASTRILLRPTERGGPLAALAGRTTSIDRDVWRSFLGTAGLYLLLALAAGWFGLLHRRSAGVLHGAALLVVVGLVSLYRLSDPGDSLRAGWALHQARVIQVGVGLALLAVLFAGLQARFGRVAAGRWIALLDGPRGDGAPAKRLYLLALVGLVLQLPFGETGIAVPGLGSLQPIEPARTLVVVYLAYWTARAIESKREGLRGAEGLRARWSYMVHALPVLVLVGLCYGLRDISPILVFTAFLAVLYWLSLVRPSTSLWPPSRWRDHVALELLAIPALLVGVVALVLARPTGTAARRLAVWWDPWGQSADAYQALTALWTTASGGVWGHGWQGGNGVLPPAVQDDFILALVAARAGSAGVALVAGTFALVLLTGALALESRREALPGRAARDHLALLGGGMLLMLAIQAGVVLGSATGGLPVMGQPLPFVASAGSHLLLFCLPAVGCVLAATRIPAGEAATLALRREERRRSRRSAGSLSDAMTGEPITEGGR